MNTLVWGVDGARVINSTEQFIAEVAQTGGSELICNDTEVNLGEKTDWEGRSAGEPERFNGEFWTRQVALDPQWSINIEGLPATVSPGEQFPGDVFFRADGDDLCVVDVSWSTLIDKN